MKQKEEWNTGANWWNNGSGEKGRPHQEKDIDPVLFELLGTITGKNILDAGCGNGYLSRLLAQKKAHVTAFDFSSELIRIAEEIEKKQPLGITYFTKDAADLSGIESDSFDVVVANMSLMDIENCAEAVKEFSRVLKPGGRFVFSIIHPVFWDFSQTWTIAHEKERTYFARVIPRYLSEGSEKRPFTKDFSVHQYHRPISKYSQYMSDAGLLIKNIREISTSELPKKAQAEGGDTSLRRSAYTTEEERIIKTEATKEIPFFLIVEAIKI